MPEPVGEGHQAGVETELRNFLLIDIFKPLGKLSFKWVSVGIILTVIFYFVNEKKRTAMLESTEGLVYFLREGDSLGSLKIRHIDQTAVAYLYLNEKGRWTLERWPATKGWSNILYWHQQRSRLIPTKRVSGQAPITSCYCAERGATNLENYKWTSARWIPSSMQHVVTG